MLLTMLACIAGIAAFVGKIAFGFLFADDFLLIAVLPSIVAVVISASFVTRSKAFLRRGHWGNAVFICLLSFVMLFLLLIPAIWIWFQFNWYLMHERPSGVSGIVFQALGYAVVAFIVSAIPAILIEYVVIRTVRARWSPVVTAGVAT
jgi:hypothetical protein